MQFEYLILLIYSYFHIKPSFLFFIYLNKSFVAKLFGNHYLLLQSSCCNSFIDTKISGAGSSGAERAEAPPGGEALKCDDN